MSPSVNATAATSVVVMAQTPDGADLDGLRAENAALKRRADEAEALAGERQGRIEDLLGALRMLPAAWADRLERIAKDRSTQEGEKEALRELMVDAIWEDRSRVAPAEVIEVPASPAETEPPEPETPTDPEPTFSLAPEQEGPVEPPPVGPAEMAQAEEAWAAARELRDRLERERLDREMARLRAEGPR
jgi:hypothetical protein